MANELFDELAKRYDSDKQIFLASIIQKEVEAELEESQDKTFLDYGSGTGLVSLDLASYVDQLYLIDSSKEMTAITTNKIKTNQIENASALCRDLIKEDLTFKVDIILVSLVLLHIPDTDLVLKQLYKHLNPKGKLIIVDFDKNEKITDSRVHNGFDKQELKEKMQTTGFVHVSSDTFYQGEKLFMKEDASLCLTLGYK